MSLLTIKLIISLGASLLIIALLNRALRNVLSDLCPTPAQVSFWVTYSRIMLILAPLWVVFVADIFVDNQDLYESVRNALIAALSGLLLGLLRLGNRIFTPVKNAIPSEAKWGEEE